MKIKIAIVLFFSFWEISFSQTEEWGTYDFDSIVAIDMPFEVYETDTIIDNQKIYEIYSSSDSSQFLVKKVFLGRLYSNVETIKSPHNENSLDKMYSDLIWFLTEPIESVFNSSKAFTKNNLKGYKLLFNNDKGIPVHEIGLFIVNKNFYSFSYLNINGINEVEKNMFFDSIVFNDKYELKQYHKEPYYLNRKIVLILAFFLILSFFLRFKSKKRKQIN